MAAVFGKKALHAVPRKSTRGPARRHTAGWLAKAGPQHRAISDRVHRFICDTHGDDQGLHLHSALGSIGRLSGFAAQYVVWQKATGSIDPCAEQCTALERELTVALMLGRPHQFARQVEAYLVPAADARLAPHGTTDCLLSIAGEAVTAAGGQPMTTDEALEIIAIAQANGGDGTAATVTGVHPDDFSLCQWPLVKNLLAGLDEADAASRACPAVAPVHWPLLLAEVAARLIAQARTAHDPAVALRLVVEAAVPASLINPKHVPATIEAAHALARSRREQAIRRYA